MKVYRSKIDAAIIVLISSGLIGPAMLFVSERNLTGMLILLATTILVLYMLFDTKYSIDGTTLRVKSGFLVNKKNEIRDIVAITKTDSLLSAPASSITERIAVQYNPDKSVVISPKAQKEFIDQLLLINPDIRIAL